MLDYSAHPSLGYTIHIEFPKTVTALLDNTTIEQKMYDHIDALSETLVSHTISAHPSLAIVIKGRQIRRALVLRNKT